MKSSELILNSDGSIYHLALKPGEVSPLVITVGDQDRVEMISRYFEEVELKRQRREFVTHTGRFQGRRITVISTGIGTDNIDIVFNELHALREMSGQSAPYRFIRLGTSGAVRPEIELDAILISKAALGLDGLLHFYRSSEDQSPVEELLSGDERWQSLPRPYFSEASADLTDHFTELADVQGVTLTAPGFYAPQGRSVCAPARLSDFIALLSKTEVAGQPLTNIEMETAGIYGLARLLGHEAISISAILANRYTGHFSKSPEQVVENMIKAALEKISQLPA